MATIGVVKLMMSVITFVFLWISDAPPKLALAFLVLSRVESSLSSNGPWGKLVDWRAGV